MSMIYCHKCGKLVSTRAEFCCRCGETIDERASAERELNMLKRKQVTCTALILIVFIGIAVSLSYLVMFG